MKLRSLFTVLFGVLAAAAAFSLILVMDATLRRAVEDRVTERIEREIDHVAQDMRGVAPENLDPFFRRSAGELLCRITLIRPDGTVSNDTDVRPSEVAQMENHARRPEVIEARRSGRGDSRRFSATEQENRFYFARLLPDGNVLRLSVAAAQVRELESGYLWSARAAVVLACLLLFVDRHGRLAPVLRADRAPDRDGVGDRRRAPPRPAAGRGAGGPAPGGGPPEDEGLARPRRPSAPSPSGA